MTYSVVGRPGRPSATGTTIDLSAGGARLEVETRLLLGDVLDLEIAAGETVLRARARVVHVTASSAGRGQLEAGAQFLDLDDQSAALLDSLIASAPA